ncbi:hypothetical protein D3H65_25685 [Paraflavitalea soli]|uniref:Uncharacterized protein n=1 Tax=Paraflavitalea soli TaxID=2315862 RepID=A0A3B7MRK3_9BACT|nr:VanZ family protein [Paraflavitalea soli]AXY77164.1 hypothetical protein D3H65_25685 [Paraflavitalea soli]
MRSLLQKLCAKKLLPIIWTIITIVLLCLPGSSIPGDGIVFNIPNFDKIVHVILFGGIVLLWGAHYVFRPEKLQGWQKLIILLAILSTALGIVLEYVQFYFIPQRSFDKYDIVADASGAIAAMFLVLFLSPRQTVKG